MRKHKHTENENEAASESAQNEAPNTEAGVEEANPIQDELDHVRKENQELKDQLLRVMADLQNMRKRHAAELLGYQQYAAEELVTALLPVLDNLERMLASIDSGASPESIVEGSRVMEKQFRAILESKKLAKIPTVGHKFDENVHDALVAHQQEGVEDGTITDEIQAGYMLGDKVIRPAKVRVVKTS